MREASSYDQTILKLEMEKLKNIVHSDIEANKSSENALSWSNLTSGATRKALIIGMVLAALDQFCGCFALLSYTATIFRISGSDLTPGMSSIVVGIIQVLGSIAPTILVERAGRKVRTTH